MGQLIPFGRLGTGNPRNENLTSGKTGRAAGDAEKPTRLLSQKLAPLIASLRVAFLVFGSPLRAAGAGSAPDYSTIVRLLAAGRFGLFLESTQHRLPIASAHLINLSRLDL